MWYTGRLEGAHSARRGLSVVFCNSSPPHSVFMTAQALAANSICDLTLGTCVDQKQRLLGPHDVMGCGGSHHTSSEPTPAFLLCEKETPCFITVYLLVFWVFPL